MEIKERIAEVLGAHGQHDYMFNGGDWSENCACGFKLFGIDYSPEHKVFPGRSYADCAHAAHQASMLAPVLADVWAEGHQAGWDEHESPGPFVNDYWDSKLPNPYNP